VERDEVIQAGEVGEEVVDDEPRARGDREGGIGEDATAAVVEGTNGSEADEVPDGGVGG
jgi:hypothetical protein